MACVWKCSRRRSALDPDRGRAYAGKNRPDDAEKALFNAVKFGPDDWTAHNALGTLYYRQIRLNDAAGEWQRTVDSAPNNVRALNNLGSALLGLDRSAEARGYYQRSAQIEPNRTAYSNLGIVLFAVGEMLASPKMNEYLGVIAPEGEKALYMGYANMPVAIGWSYGSFMGGRVYDQMGDKANLALRYLSERRGLGGIERTSAVAKLQEVLGIDAVGATQLLWDTYHPYRLWYPFAAVGLASAVGILLYARWVRDQE